MPRFVIRGKIGDALDEVDRLRDVLVDEYRRIEVLEKRSAESPGNRLRRSFGKFVDALRRR